MANEAEISTTKSSKTTTTAAVQPVVVKEEKPSKTSSSSTSTAAVIVPIDDDEENELDSVETCHGGNGHVIALLIILLVFSIMAFGITYFKFKQV